MGGACLTNPVGSAITQFSIGVSTQQIYLQTPLQTNCGQAERQLQLGRLVAAIVDSTYR